MTQETYRQARILAEASNNVYENISKIETSRAIGENLSAGVYVHISKDNLDWFVGVCKERYKDLYRQLDEL